MRFTAWAMAEMEDKGGLPVPKSYSGQFVQLNPQDPSHASSPNASASEGVQA